MSLATYTDLLSQVPNWLARPGDTTRLTAANVADLITLCEQRIAYGAGDDTPFPSPPMRVRGMEVQRTLTVKGALAGGTVGGTANAITLTPTSAATSYAVGDTYELTPTADNTGATTVNISSLGAKSIKKGSALSDLEASDLVSGGTFRIYYDGTQFVLMVGKGSCPLPPSYLAMRTLYVDTTADRRPLEYITPQQMNEVDRMPQASEPFHFTLEGDCLRLGPSADQTYYLPCLYYKKLTPLASAAGGTNWIMTNAPGVYLFGSLIEAAAFIGLDSRMQLWHGMYLSACRGLAQSDQIDRHSGSALTMRTATGNP